MGFLLRVRLASFFVGAAAASSVGLYILHKDYIHAYDFTLNKMKSLHESLESRVSALEKLKETEVSQPLEAAE